MTPKEIVLYRISLPTTLCNGSVKNKAKYTNKGEAVAYVRFLLPGTLARPSLLVVYFAFFFTVPFQRIVGIPYLYEQLGVFSKPINLTSD